MVRDTVRAIVDGIGYRRAMHTSLLERAWLWVVEQVDRLFGAAGDFPHGRTIGLIAVGLIVLLIIGRIAWASRLGVDELDAARERAGRLRAPSLADADQLASAGDYLEAAHVAYRAVLETLARRDGVRLHRSKTSGDYYRELRRRGSSAAHSFRQFARRHDHVVYGIGACDADAWSALRAHAQLVLRLERAA